MLTVLPPSINEAYTKTKFGMVKSAAMKKFLTQARAELLQQVTADIPFFDKARPHRLTLEVFLPALYNKGWPKQTDNRFKRKDASNLVKVVEDLIAEVIGIDDSCFLTSNISKFDGPTWGFEGVKFLVEEIPDGAVVPCI